jgi:hypothetical protein
MDYKFRYTKDGRKTYYYNGQRVNKGGIPPEIIDNIKEDSIDRILDEKYKKKLSDLMERRNALRNELLDLETRIAGLGMEKERERVDAYKKRNEGAAKAASKPKPERKPERKPDDRSNTEKGDEWWSKFKNDFYKNTSKPQNATPPPTPPVTEKQKACSFLASHGIHNKKDWKKWMVLNHPDKLDQSDPDRAFKDKLAALINDAVRTMQW